MTEIWACSAPLIAKAATLLRHGGLVAFPTETVYGLGAHALDAAAAARIFEAKRRALNDPLIVHITEPEQQDTLFDSSKLSAQARAALPLLRAAFWPGPLTLVGPKQARVPAIVTAGTDSVAVRIPDHPVARALICAAGVPIAAPSANLFGHVSPTTAQHVLADLDGRIDLILDDGPTRIGVESTVLSLLSWPPAILRPGGVTREQLEALGIPIAVADSQPVRHDAQAMPAPGMLSSHYAPNAQVWLFDTRDALLAAYSNSTLRCGALLLTSDAVQLRHIQPVFELGATLDDAAQALYAGLRTLDDAGVEVILALRPAPHGIGAALRDRLSRAAVKRNIAT
jgi:L-threonylcarbamoyladenylate synthase